MSPDIAQLNHGNATVSVSVPKAALDVANADGTAKGTSDATLTPGTQTVSLNIAACQSGARLLVTPQGKLADGLMLTRAQCNNGSASVTFTNYTTTAASGSVTVSYEVIR